ncbi:MAG TPA: sulfotransferase [Solirubrobacteraceae bacterium]|jgi:predicted naringenin-chalcone synthase
MQVIGAGFGRTGTMSLKVALEELGAGPCLHSLEGLASSRYTAPEPALVAAAGPSTTYWERLAKGERIDWREAFVGWGSVLDWVGARYYPEILEAWPEAKVILSVRDPEDWYESCNESLRATWDVAGPDGDAHYPPVLRAADSAIWQDIFGGRFDEREHAIEIFERHREQVIERVPAERLLIYDIREGWQPLCELLGVALPETPFPHLNGRSAFLRRFGTADETKNGELIASHRPIGGTAEPGAAEAKTVEASTGVKARIAGLALADPIEILDQQQVLSLLGLAEDEFAQRIFSRCGVERRELDLTPELLRHTLQGRTAHVEQRLLQRSVEAVEKLRVDPQEIGSIVSASLYSLGCPTLAHNLIEHCGMDPATDKYHLVGVGCASAVPMLRLAAQGLATHPGKKVLVVAAESMSGMLMGATPEDARAKTVGSAIFGDGCAAMLLDGEGASGPEILASKVHQIPSSLDAVALAFSDTDSYLHLAKDLPDVAGEHLRGLVGGFLQDNGLTGHMIDHWLIHPGGRRIVEEAQRALSLSDEEVAVSFEVLANQGNVGTPSIFYVLQKAIEQRKPCAGERGLLVTIGPGVTIGLMLIRW